MVLWRTICASGLTSARPSIATRDDLEHGSGQPAAAPPDPRDEQQHEDRGEGDLGDGHEDAQPREPERVDVQVHPAQRGRHDAEGAHAERAERQPGHQPVLRGLAGCASGGDRDDDEGEGGDHDQLGEPLPRVLGVGEALGLQHVAVAAEQRADLDRHEQQDQRVEREHREEPLAALRGRPRREPGVGPAGRREREVREGRRDDGHEHADDDLAGQQVRLHARHEVGEDAVGAGEQEPEHQQQTDGDPDAAQRDQQLPATRAGEGLDALRHPRQRPDGARRPGQRREHGGRCRPGRRHGDHAGPDGDERAEHDDPARVTEGDHGEQGDRQRGGDQVVHVASTDQRRGGRGPDDQADQRGTEAGLRARRAGRRRARRPRRTGRACWSATGRRRSAQNATSTRARRPASRGTGTPRPATQEGGGPGRAGGVGGVGAPVSLMDDTVGPGVLARQRLARGSRARCVQWCRVPPQLTPSARTGQRRTVTTRSAVDVLPGVVAEHRDEPVGARLEAGHGGPDGLAPGRRGRELLLVDQHAVAVERVVRRVGAPPQVGRHRERAVTVAVVVGQDRERRATRP